MNRQWYRMGEGNIPNRGAIFIGQDIDGKTEEVAHDWNQAGYGIFWTVNDFGDGGRLIKNLQRINSWAIDIDDGSKKKQIARIESCRRVPSMIVETKRGFQVYWNAKNACPEHWNAIVLDRLVPHFGADANARDLARIMRVPGFLHQKEPANPVEVKLVFEKRVAYTEEQMASAFPDHGARRRAEIANQQAMREVRAIDPAGDAFWDRVFSLDCEEALLRLSGHSSVRGEQYTFKRVRNGNLNILVNGKGTSCWVDRDKRIGSLANGGPSCYQWLRWFGHTPQQCAEVLKHIFPELVQEKCQ